MTEPHIEFDVPDNHGPSWCCVDLRKAAIATWEGDKMVGRETREWLAAVRRHDVRSNVCPRRPFMNGSVA